MDKLKWKKPLAFEADIFDHQGRLPRDNTKDKSHFTLILG